MTRDELELELHLLEEIIDQSLEDKSLVPRALVLVELVATTDVEARLRALIVVSEALIAQQDLQGVNIYLDEANTYCSDELRRKHYSKLLALEGRKYYAMGQCAGALEYFLRAHSIQQELGLEIDLARLKFNIGSAYSLLSEYSQAMQYLQEARETFETRGFLAQLAKVSVNIANIYSDTNEYASALELYGKAVAIGEQLDLKRVQAIAIGNIGNVHNMLTDYAKALSYMNNALALHEELGMREDVVRVTGVIGNIYLNLADFPKALEYYNRALDLCEELENKTAAIWILGNMGNIYNGLSDFPKALEYYGRALLLNEELGRKSGSAIVLSNLGIVYSNLSDFSKALEYLNQSLSLLQQMGMKQHIGRVIFSIGEVYLKLCDYPRALDYYSRALEDARTFGVRRQEGYALAGIGQIYLGLNDLTKARQFLNESLDFRRKSSLSEQEIAFSSLFLAQLDQQEGRADEAIAGFSAVVDVFARLGIRESELRAHEGLAALYAEAKDFEKAYKHQLRSVQLGAELNLDQARKQAEQIDVERKQAERVRLQAAEALEREKIIAGERAAAAATTALLHRVLPSSVAERLIKGEKVADYFQHISILFADIVGFTPIAARMPAKKVLAFLNYVFGEFDRVIEKHGCQKIKTIGDGYMAVSGAPETCDDHAERLAMAAKELMNDIALPEDIRAFLPKGSVFHLRIGIHTGSAFAGVVGDKGFVYDVYSDAVNFASRMESSGEAGKIHVSEEFAMHLQNRDESFAFEEREEIDIKGKGRVRTYFMS